jgi:hypothetical protein
MTAGKQETCFQQILPRVAIQQILLDNNRIKVVVPGGQRGRKTFVFANRQHHRLITIGWQPLTTEIHQSGGTQQKSNSEGRPGHPTSGALVPKS